MSLINLLLLTEAVAGNYLYHFTNIDRAQSILQDNTIYGRDTSWSAGELTRSKYVRKKDKHNVGVSFTRNKDFATDGRFFAKGYKPSVGLVFKRETLAHHYKIYPFDVHGADVTNQGSNAKLLGEEIILSNIEDVRNIIEFIYVPVGHIEHKIQARGEYITTLLPLLRYIRKNRHDIDVKFDYKHGFKDLDINYPSDGKHSEQVYYIYKQIFK